MRAPSAAARAAKIWASDPMYIGAYVWHKFAIEPIPPGQLLIGRAVCGVHFTTWRYVILRYIPRSDREQFCIRCFGSRYHGLTDGGMDAKNTGAARDHRLPAS